MRNALALDRSELKEAAVINSDDTSGPGTQWDAYCKLGKHAIYFDSFGNLKPPKELIDNLGVDRMKYNY